MGLFGPLFGDSGGGGDGGSSPTFPSLAIATTRAAIRRQIVVVIEALSPTTLPGVKFRHYRKEGDADFDSWIAKNPTAALRRFSVRHDGRDEPPNITNTDYRERRATFEIRIAYPQTGKYGVDWGDARDDAAEIDFKKLDFALGIEGGRANFQSPADAMPWGCELVRELDDGNDVMVLTATFTYQSQSAGS